MRVALDRGDVAGPAPPRTGGGRRSRSRIRRRRRPWGRRARDQRRHDVARRLDRGVEDDHDRGRRPPDPDVPGRAGPEPLARPDDLEPVVQSSASAASCSAEGPSATTTNEVPSGACARRPASARSRSSGQSVATDDHGRQARRRLVEPRRHGSARAVPNRLRVLDRRRSSGLEGEVGPAVDDLPAGRLDLGPEPVRLRPVAG